MQVYCFSKAIAGAVIVAVLAACGGSGSGSSDNDEPQTVAAEVAKTGQEGGLPLLYSYDPGGATAPYVRRRVGENHAGQVFPEQTIAGMPADFNSYKLESPFPFFILRGLTPTGEGEIYLEPGRTTGKTTLMRLSETTLPDSGMVTYTGTYAGLYSVVGERETAGHMFGRAQLELDFASNTLSGLIDQRANSGGQAATDITLELGAMADGSFSGTTTGGAFASGYSSAPGTYGGLIVGQNGEEAIGQATVYHNGATDYVETGGFIVGVCNPNC